MPSIRLLLILLLVVESVAAARWQQPSVIAKAFQEVALKQEHGPDHGRLHRWQQPLKVWVSHQVGDKQMHNQLVDMHLRHLKTITGMPISRVSSRSKSNVQVFFSRQSKWQAVVRREMNLKQGPNLRGAVCMANYAVNGRGEITRGLVVIPVDQARMHGKLLACVVEELTQLMGLPNDSEYAYPSIFNDKTPQDLLSGLDWLLLKLLYLPELEPGMSRQQIKPILSARVRKWQSDGTISRAWREVKKGELYPLMGY
jgi:hypothetical protein